MTYLLHTNTCIGVLTNRVATLAERWKQTRPSQIRLCSVVKAEPLRMYAPWSHLLQRHRAMSTGNEKNRAGYRLSTQAGDMDRVVLGIVVMIVDFRIR